MFCVKNTRKLQDAVWQDYTAAQIDSVAQLVDSFSNSMTTENVNN